VQEQYCRQMMIASKGHTIGMPVDVFEHL